MPKPISIETAFGDPEAVDKAAANMQQHEFCRLTGLHCPWFERCSTDPDWQCPAYGARAPKCPKCGKPKTPAITYLDHPECYANTSGKSETGEI